MVLYIPSLYLFFSLKALPSDEGVQTHLLDYAMFLFSLFKSVALR